MTPPKMERLLLGVRERDWSARSKFLKVATSLLPKHKPEHHGTTGLMGPGSIGNYKAIKGPKGPLRAACPIFRSPRKALFWAALFWVPAVWAAPGTFAGRKTTKKKPTMQNRARHGPYIGPMCPLGRAL